MRRSTIGTRLIWMTIGAILTIAPLLTTFPAQVAQAAEPACVKTGTTYVCTFSYIGASQVWVVPDTVTSATFDVYGGSGGGLGSSPYGGKGGRATATLAVTPDQQILLVVGGEGGTANYCDGTTPMGGGNGGGNGGGISCPGAGGGGASDIRIGGAALTDRVLVAGGGGGAANATGSSQRGGGGGGLIGMDGSADIGETGAQGGNQDCTTGSLAAGVGASGVSVAYPQTGGGGGGGGWCGGAGGAWGHGGGGGSGHGPAGTTFETGVNTGDGKIIVTYDVIDVATPSTTVSFSNNYDPYTWTNQPVTVTASVIDDISTPAEITTYLGRDNGSCAPATPTHCQVYTGPVTYSVSGDYDLIYFSIDGAGNAESAHYTGVRVDVDSPTATRTITGTTGNNGWYISPVTVDWTWTDQHSGINWADCPTSRSVPVDGRYTVQTWCFDNVGNYAASGQDINVDQTAPAASPTFSGQLGMNDAGFTGWFVSPVTVKWNWSDATSGIDPASCPATTFVDTDGDQSVSATCTDMAGNSATRTVSLKVDLNTPAANPAYSGTQGNNGWYTSPASVQWNWSDAGSGIDTARCDLQVGPLGDGSHPVSGQCRDIAGNLGATTATLNVDQTAPVAAPTLSGPTGKNGWFTGQVTATWNWSDLTSGIDAANCPTTSSTSTDGSSPITTTCADLAGNSASASLPVKLDQTPPTVTYTGNAGSYTIDQQITITCTATDATSGIASTTCQNISGPAASFGPDSHTFSATATDYAGHTSSASVTFSVSVDYASLANLTCQMLERPTACRTLSYYLASAEWAEGRHIGMLQQHYLNLYSSMVTSLRGHGLTAQEVQTLLDLARVFYPQSSRGR